MMNILFEPVLQEGKAINIPPMKHDLIVFHLSRAFGEFPITLRYAEKFHKDLDRLVGMSATWSETWSNPYEELARELKRYGSIRVWISA